MSTPSPAPPVPPAPAARLRLSIRARLTLWYSVIALLMLLCAGTSVLYLHARLGLARVATELADAGTTYVGVIEKEMDEELPLRSGVLDMMRELDLPGFGVAVLTGDRQVIASRTSGAGVLPVAVLTAQGDTDATTAAEHGTLVRRIRARHRGESFEVVVWLSLADFDRERATLRSAMLMGLPLAVVIAAIGGWSVSRRVLSPVSDMAAQAERIGRHARAARLDVPNAYDELGTLARAFNGLLDRLSAALHAQRAFMADASHQLRTPVSVTRTAAQVTLARAHRSEEEYRESLEIIAGQAERLSKMVDDMFTLTLADADARPLQMAPLYLDEIVEDVAAGTRLLAIARQLELHIESAGEIPFTGDEHLLRQMLTNLVDNAVRHTPPGGEVSVSLGRSQGGAVLDVADTGPGVRPGDEERIFNRFVRCDGPGAEGGAGLGLPIARWIAEAHGGRLELASTGPRGSRFVVWLPIDRGRAARPAARPSGVDTADAAAGAR